MLKGLAMPEDMSFEKSKRKPTMADVAREAGVSRISVIRFFNTRKRMDISPETRAKIELAIQKLAYAPSPFARKRHPREKFTFGLLTSLSKEIMKSGYHMGILGGICDRVFKTGHALRFFHFSDRPYERLEDIFFEQGLDGLLIITWRIEPSLIRLVEKCQANLPVVIFNDFDPALKASILYCDVCQGMKDSVAYLAGKGYKGIGLLKAPSEVLFKNSGKAEMIPSVDIQGKLEGFMEGMKNEGIRVRKSWICESASYHEDDAYQSMKDWISSKTFPRAILCTNDEIALGALRALKEAKLWCPEKVALMGFDDSERSRFVSPSLTTVRQPLYQMGYDSVDILIDRVEYPNDKSIQKKFAPELMIRQTA